MSGISGLYTPLPQNMARLDLKKASTSGMEMAAPASELERVDRLEFSRSFVDDAAQKTKKFSDSLVERLEKAEIGLRDIRNLKDSFSITLKDGQITVTGPYKDQIEVFLRDNPGEAKKIKDELKEILALNALIALKEANARYAEDKKKADSVTDPEKRNEAMKKADMRHLERSNRLNALSGTMTYRDGAFTSAALDYMRSISA